MRIAPVLVIALATFGCKKREEPQPRAVGSGSAGMSMPKVVYGPVDRMTFNRTAVHLNLPVYWTADANNNKMIEPDEVVPLLFYPTHQVWVEGGAFTPAFEETFATIVGAAKEPPPDDKREQLVIQD